MKKKLLALFAACSVITTAAAGLVQTAYATEPGVRIGVADGTTDTQKIITLYYEGVDAMISITGQLTFTGGTVTINKLSVTIPNDSAQADKNNGSLYFSSYEDEGTSTDDGAFAQAVVTVPGDVDITASFEIKDFTEYSFEAEDWVEYGNTLGTVSTVIPKKEAPTEAPTAAPTEAPTEAPTAAPTEVPQPVVAKSVEKANAFTKDGGYDDDVVVGTIQLDVTGAAIDLTKATYKGNKPTKVDGENVTTFQGSALITVIINGETSTDALNQVVFN